MILLGLSGKKQSGKNTVARMIRNLAQGKVVELGFADALKDEVCVACNISRDYLEEHKKQFRPILQWWGTEFRRVSDNYYWIQKLGNIIASPTFFADIVIVTDVRFKNEAVAIKLWHGVTIRVERHYDFLGDPHPSEIDLDDYPHDFEVLNYQDLTKLQENVVELCHKLHIKLK